ncbi:MAG TPA: sigma-54 dependent transcriptional regulator [Myxococcales bacterium]
MGTPVFSATSPRLLLVAGEEAVRESLKRSLPQDGFTLEIAADAPMAVQRLREQEFAVLLVDLEASGAEGILDHARELRPHCAAVVMVAYSGVAAAVAAMKRGACDYVLKPVDLEEVSLRVRRIVAQQQLAHDNAVLRKALARRNDFHDLVAKSPAMQKVFELARVAARSSSPVLILGENGTGKEVLARAIHEESPCRAGPFVAVSSSGMSAELLESARGGTLYLEEISDLSPAAQIDLLRLVEVHRAPAEAVERDVRIVAATSRDLARAVAEGRFGEDLFYRLSIVSLRLPPLRERKEDIPLLVEAFLDTLSAESGRPPRGISQQALAALMSQSWPGNVCELRKAIELGAEVAQGPVIDLADLGLEPAPAFTATGEPLSLEELEKRHIVEVLSFARNNVTQSARILGIDRVTLYNKIKRYRLPHR